MFLEPFVQQDCNNVVTKLTPINAKCLDTLEIYLTFAMSTSSSNAQQ